MGNSHHRVSVCVSVTCLYCIKMAKRRFTLIAQGILVFWRQESLVDDPLPPEICAQSDPSPFQATKFWPIFAHSASTVRASKKSSISTNRKSITLFPTSHRWTVYVTPKSVAQNAILLFLPVNFKFCRKKVCCKVSSCEKFQQQVVCTSFLYLTVHR